MKKRFLIGLTSLEKDDEVNTTLVVNPNTNSAYISSINY